MEMILDSLLNRAESLWPDKPFVYTRNGHAFSAKTFGEFASDVRALSVSLIEQGLAGKHILVFGENSYEWMVADYAACGFVGVSVAIGKDAKRGDVLSAIEKTDIAAVFYSENLSVETAGLSELLGIPFFSLQTELYRLIESSRTTGIAETDALAGCARRDADALCKVYFTSGTTSNPKAVMLSQKNIFSGVESLNARAPLSERDSGYLFLPLSHTYGGIYNFLYGLHYGVDLYLCSDTNLIIEELRMVRPTIFCAVPRVLERLLGAAKASKDPAETLRQLLGGNIRYLFCSGAPWRSEDRAFYKSAGIDLLEAYALTETASSLSLSYSGESENESVGVVFENVDVRIANPDNNGFGEILVRGENVFSGYYKDEEATRAAFDTEGYFHTRDWGKIDDTRHLYVAGRIGKPFKTSAGEFIDSKRIELLLLADPRIKSASVISDEGRVAVELELSDSASDIPGALDKVNRQLPDHMRIQAYSVAGSLTDTAQANWKSVL